MWGGPAEGITAVHLWTSTEDVGGVRVHTEESWEGDPVDARIADMQAALDGSLRTWLVNLKAVAEAQT